MEVPKSQRLQEVYRRLALAPAAETFTEMRDQLADVLNAVEDQLTGVPYDRRRWQTDGRLYPVQDDNVYGVDGHPDVRLLRARGSMIYIGDNGAIEIQDVVSGAVDLSKPGSDGRGVWELAQPDDRSSL
ncbi:MAG TPA: hypothetical protein VE871_19245 [Longimicrobium sp.]|nr:hypothetical protein [Longimicrobium sp.]